MRHAAKLLTGVLAAGLVLTGCGDAPQKTSGGPGDDEYGTAIDLVDDYDPDGHFSWGYNSFASNWDPIKSINGSDQNFYEPVYDRLLFQTADGDIEPMLAEKFEASEDNLSLTLHLRSGLTFSDGTPFNADAVKYNLDRARGEGSNIAGELSQVESVEVVDDLTVTLHLSGGLGPLPVSLSDRPGIIVSPTAAEAGLLDNEPVGIGPYLTTEIVPGDRAEFEKTPGYWDPDAQKVATMTYHYMPDDQTRLNALRSGELDGARINPDEMDSLAADGIVPIVKPSPLYLYFAVNTATAPFDDPNVRKALNMALDREAISQGLYDGYCTPQIQPFPEGSLGYSEEIGSGLDIFPYDPAAAKQILEDAGVTEPITITSVAPNVTIYTKFAEVIQNQLADVGINVELQIVPPSEMVQKFSMDKSAEGFSSVTTGISDPDIVTTRYIEPSSLFNPGGTVYPELSQYAAEGAAAFDPAERQPAYEKYMQAWVESPPHHIPICTIHLASAYTQNVSGVAQRVSGYPDLRGIAVSND